jgi:protein-S-isoprenylcysteine O-methyltransferase Ste14
MPDQPERRMQDHPDVRVPPPLLYLSVLGIGLLVQQTAPLPVIPPSAGHPLAIACAAGWVGLMVWGVSSFRRARTSLIPIRPATALITDGPFRFTRNPLYLSLALLYLAIAFWLGVLWPIVLLPALLLLVQQVVILREEAYLESRFGEAYRAYRARVRRWL